MSLFTTAYKKIKTIKNQLIRRVLLGLLCIVLMMVLCVFPLMFAVWALVTYLSPWVLTGLIAGIVVFFILYIIGSDFDDKEIEISSLIKSKSH